MRPPLARSSSFSRSRPGLGARGVGLGALLGLGVALGGVVAFADSPPKQPGFAPDPPGHASTKQWMFQVTVKKGVPELTGARVIELAKPAESPRVMGRFAVELYVGPELLDRVRFDVPLMGIDPPPKSPRHPWPRPGFEDVNTKLEVRVADHPRAVYVVLVDRMTLKTTRYEWPPAADGHLVPWKPPQFAGPDAWPPPGAPGVKDAGARDAPSGG